MADEPVDFRDLLNKPLSEFPDMPNLPAGKTFYGKIMSMTAGSSREKGTPFLHVDVRLTDPGPDVSKEAMDGITNAGFSLADYSVGRDFYLTPRSMVFLRRFMTSLGFSENVSFREGLKLADTGEPTPDTQETIRGKDVLVKLPAADAEGRVFQNNVDQIAGVAR